MDRKSVLTVLKALGILEKGKTQYGLSPMREGVHEFSSHRPVWAWCASPLSTPFGKKPGARRIFELLPPGTTAPRAVQNTRLAVVIGAADSEVFRYLAAKPDTVLLLFEPEEKPLEDFLGKFAPKDLAAANLFIFSGKPQSLASPLSHLLPRKLFDLGYPVFFVQKGLEEAYAGYISELIEQIEFIYYRFNIYPVGGALYSRSLPLRNITTHLYFDQQKHFYENIQIYLNSISVELIKNRFKGATAMVVLAGPGLDDRIEYIKRYRDRVLLICVNSALAPLLANGVEPDMALISDNTTLSGVTLDSIKRKLTTVMVGHCLSPLKSDSFSKTVVYGSWNKDLFGDRPDLLTHGSVVTTAYSLAEYLGCDRCVLVSAILAGTSPHRPLSYAKGTTQHTEAGEKVEHEALTHSWPELYPVKNSLGQTMYTTLNFRDTALWFLDELRTRDVQCVNTDSDSILQGPGVVVDERFEPPESPVDVAGTMDGIRAMEPDGHDMGAVRAFLDKERCHWERVKSLSEELENMDDHALVAAGPGVVAKFDAENVTFLVHRFENFENRIFHGMVFEEADTARRAKGLRYFFSHTGRMAAFFLKILDNTATGITEK